MKEKLFLINPYFKLYGDPPLGLAYLAAYVRNHIKGLDIKILDLLEDEEVFKILLKERPKFIGISAVSQNYYAAVSLGKAIKKILPNSILLIGGVHITVCPTSFKSSPFDLAVRGEGEIPTRKFFEAYEKNTDFVRSLSKTPGFILRKGSKIIDTGLAEQVKNLDDIPLPARDLLNMDFYRLPRFSSEDLDANGALITSRGCPYSCKFCCSSAFWGRSIRFFSPKRVVEEIKILHKKYGYTSICIYDDLFSVNKVRLREIVRLLDKEGLLGKLKFDALARANSFDEETAMLFKKMGITCATFGFETGSPKILKYLKGESVTIEDGAKALKIARKHGLKTGGFFMVGSPTENLKDIEGTYNFIKNNKLDNAILFQVTAYPGTECWNYALEKGIMNLHSYDEKHFKHLEDLNDINPELLLSQEITKEEFIKAYARLKSLVGTKRVNFLSRALMLRPRHLRAMLNKSFINIF
jgi:radical SAM superfamily enzyme YgiQ (UPF0313 family)